MTSRTMPRCTRGVLGIDTPDDTSLGMLPVGEPSPELLDRALVGWERYVDAAAPAYAPEAIRVPFEPQTAAEAVRQ